MLPLVEIVNFAVLMKFLPTDKLLFGSEIIIDPKPNLHGDSNTKLPSNLIILGFSFLLNSLTCPNPIQILPPPEWWLSLSRLILLYYT